MSQYGDSVAPSFVFFNSLQMSKKLVIFADTDIYIYIYIYICRMAVLSLSSSNKQSGSLTAIT